MKQVYSRFCVLFFAVFILTATTKAQVTLTISSSSNISCNGGNDGTATATPTGVGPYSFLWTPSGNTNAAATGLAAGTHTCTVTDSSDMSTATATITLTQPNILSATQSQTNVLCNGGATGSTTVSVSGGTTPYTYTWLPSGGNLPSITGRAAGSYTCNITDAHGCAISKTFTITQPSVLSATMSTTMVTCNSLCNGTASIVPTGGTPPYTYAWAPSGGTAATATNLCAGTYTCTITDSNGCVATRSATVTQNLGLSASVSYFNVTCFGGSNGSATVTASGGTSPYSYSWNPLVSFNASITNVPAGTYTCTVTDANNCSIAVSVVIGQPTAISFNSVASGTCGACNGHISTTVSGGTPPYSYLWNPTNSTTSTLNNLCAGTYTCMVADANGCTSTSVATVANTPAATVTTGPDDSICLGGSIHFNAVPSGTSPFTYSWTNAGNSLNSTTISNPIATPTITSNYTVTVTDANGCVGNDAIGIQLLAPISLSLSSTSATCSQSDGSATVVASGGATPYSYSWSNSGTTPTITNLPASTYSVTVNSNLSGCTASGNVIVNNSNGPTVSFSGITDVTCFGGSNGSATANPSGGTAPYTYTWQPSAQTTQTATGLSAGAYTVTVVDATNCSSIQTVTITEPPQIQPNLTTTNITCFSQCNGSAAVAPTGGSGSYTYFWLPMNATTTSISSLCSGTYSVTITDGMGCTATQQATITQPAQLAINPTVNSCTNSQCNGWATANPSGGTAPYTINWMPGNLSTNTVNNLCTGTYTLTVTDANGCSVQNSVVIGNYVPLYLGLQIVNQPNCSMGGEIRTLTYGGVPPLTYLWSDNSTNDTLFNAAPGIYSCTVTDAVGTTIAGSISLNSSIHGVIMGKVYKDVNSNCVFDAGDIPIYMQYVTSGSGSYYTDVNGDYILTPTATGTYTVATGPNYYTLYTAPTCPSNASQTVTLSALCDTIAHVDFAREDIPGVQDLRIYFGLQQMPRAGFPQNLVINYSNVGNTAVPNVTLDLVYDSILGFISSTQNPSINQQAFLEWNLGTLLPGQYGSILTTVSVPTIQNGGWIGRPMNYVATINPTAGDYVPVDNTSAMLRHIVASWDPNEKIAYAPGMDSLGNITPADSMLSYTIHFQNTGTDTAFNIYVEDTLSPYLDLSSIRLGASSAPYTFQLLNNNVARFNFYSIMLPDSNHNVAASNGFVEFKINTLPNLPVGTTITNTGYIYFDFNPAVVTNTTSNMIWVNVTTDVATAENETISAFPNPFDASTTIQLPASISGKQNEMVLTDLQGRVVKSEKIAAANSFTLQRGNLEAGVYFCTVLSEGRVVGVTKVVVN